MHLSIRHTTRYAYQPDASQAALRLMLTPPANASQYTTAWAVRVNGDALHPLHTDALGNAVSLWHAHSPVAEIEIVAEGTVQTTDTAGVIAAVAGSSRPAMFLRQGVKTKPDAAILGLAEQITGGDPLSSMHTLSAAIHDRVDYNTEATTAQTTASEALARGAGVCQDHAHIFVSAARSMGVPARYVAGYLFDIDDELLVGDQTHAWAEAFVAGLGWVGFDVTNQLCPTDAYVRLTCGLDGGDAAPIRGVLGGAPDEVLEADVAVSSSSQSQSQSQ